ncbi:MAG: branched-chain amino acid ABC transporter permease [Paracoccaceae bacterium]|nr:branched-chain amino acid ABC transporter permease [Paracoccaceae bacterium]MDE2675370.1 branched-chain amino acid ABC transporter permease [Paracoccaceae bacterium]MYJ87030.1 branched-chain amino acid ABC transporter permease [Paracoccaceae bacterium]
MNDKNLALNIGVVGFLALLFFLVSDYHDGIIARILILAIFAMGYNLLFGYTGLLSLGHAMFFATGMYGYGLSVELWKFSAFEGLLFALVISFLFSMSIGVLTLRTKGVAFMIVTLMFSQVFYLVVLLFGEHTGGDEGFVISTHGRTLFGLNFVDPTSKYFASLFLFAVVLLGLTLFVRTRTGKCLVAIRENEERAKMLGYDVWVHKFIAIIISGVISGLAGASYTLIFGYAGAAFAEVHYSILPLLWVLLGGAGTLIGPLVGTVFAFYLIDISSGYTSAYLLIVGLVIVLLTLFAPQGLAGELKRRMAHWLQ